MEESQSKDIYDRLVSVATSNKAKFVADVPSQYLLNVCKAKPALIKPNGENISRIFGVEIVDRNDYIPYGKKLRELGAENVIISYGAQGSMLFTGDKVYGSNEINDGREIINTTACRDSMIAGFLGSMVKDGSPIEAYKMSIAAASATARVLDLPTHDQIMDMLEFVEIEEVE